MLSAGWFTFFLLLASWSTAALPLQRPHRLHRVATDRQQRAGRNDNTTAVSAGTETVTAVSMAAEECQKTTTTAETLCGIWAAIRWNEEVSELVVRLNDLLRETASRSEDLLRLRVACRQRLQRLARQQCLLSSSSSLHPHVDSTTAPHHSKHDNRDENDNMDDNNNEDEDEDEDEEEMEEDERKSTEEEDRLSFQDLQCIASKQSDFIRIINDQNHRRFVVSCGCYELAK
jgi:hypothetical protein